MYEMIDTNKKNMHDPKKRALLKIPEAPFVELEVSFQPICIAEVYK